MAKTPIGKENSSNNGKEAAHMKHTAKSMNLINFMKQLLDNTIITFQNPQARAPV
jgi:hypothetical protein